MLDKHFKTAMLTILAAVMLVSGSSYAAGKKKNQPKALDPVIDAAKTELERAMTGLKTENSGNPYFVMYRINYRDLYNISATNGGIFSSSYNHWANIYTEVRVGDYQFDNTALQGDSFSWFDGTKSLYMVPSLAPLNEDETALRSILWLLTDQKYRNASSTYFKKKGQLSVMVIDPDSKGVPAFSKEEPQVYIGPKEMLHVNVYEWKNRLALLSRNFENFPNVLYSNVRFGATRERIYVINSEGTTIRFDRIIYSLSASATARTDDGDTQSYVDVEYALSPDEFTDARIAKMIEKVGNTVESLVVAPVMDPYTGPTLLMPTAAGVLFHEAVGHRLEGERQKSSDEGQTFKGKVGQKVIPTFLTLIDDPTIRKLDGKMLMGYYPFDDEGTKARKVVLIKNGVLKNYLMSRTPIKGFLHSNGHGRAAAGMKPRGRMGNLIVIADPSKQTSLKNLKKMLIDEVKKQGKPYGVIISELSGGDTNTSSYGYQAFRGMSKVVWRLYPDGRQELVRGVDIVGTPLSAVNKIMMASKERDVFNGYCGAESGMVPVSAVSPALLLSELEFQRAKQDHLPKPILPPPYSTGKTKKK